MKGTNKNVSRNLRAPRAKEVYLILSIAMATYFLIAMAAALVLAWWYQKAGWILVSLSAELLSVLAGFFAHHLYMRAPIKNSRTRANPRLGEVKPMSPRQTVKPVNGCAIWKKMRTQVLTTAFVLLIFALVYLGIELNPIIESAVFKE